jgi:Fe-S cluster assembly protein SufD
MTQDLALTSERFKPGLGREAVERLSELRQEPAWLRERRLDAWDLYEQLPTPTSKERDWKYTDITRLDFDRFSPYAPAGLGAPMGAEGAGDVRPTAAGEAQAGVLLQQNAQPLAAERREQSSGVLFCSLDEAVQRYPDLVREHLLTRCVRPEEDKLTALHGAFWGGGVFIHVPRGAEVVLPFHSIIRATAPGLALFPHVLLIAEAHSRVSLVEEYESPSREGLALCNTVGEFFVGEGAEVRYVSVQRWDTGTYHFGTHRALLGKDAGLRYTTVGLGARLSKLRSEAILEGAGSHSEMLGLFFGERAQKFDAITLQDHRGPNTQSDLLYKSALRDAAQAVYYGRVRVGPEARGSDANQENRNLLLSERAKADSDPVLEILTSEVVRCGHGATVGPVDEEQLFYLQCRGLPRERAERLLVAAFFASVVQRIPVVNVRSALDRALLERIGA